MTYACGCGTDLMQSRKPRIRSSRYLPGRALAGPWWHNRDGSLTIARITDGATHLIHVTYPDKLRMSHPFVFEQFELTTGLTTAGIRTHTTIVG